MLLRMIATRIRVIRSIMPVINREVFWFQGETLVGSSREHAPQALKRWGIKAVLAESFAEIFFGNCTSLGIPAVCVGRDDLEKIVAVIQESPTQEITVDLAKLEVRFGNESAKGEMPESARSVLTSGKWDFLAQLLEAKDQAQETAAKLPYLAEFV